MIRLGITGCQGRMGQRIRALAQQDESFRVQTLQEHPQHPDLNQDIDGITVCSDQARLKECDVLIDFTTPASTLDNIRACRTYGVKMVIGTTGFTPEETQQITEAAKALPIVFSSNMSVGVNLLFALARQLAAAAPPAYQVRITEAHHVHKKDAPSGTAKTIAQEIESHSAHKVQNIDAIREGEIIGDHKIIFESAEDILIIDHHAKTRDIFAKGALIAARFLAEQSAGLFSMQEVLGIRRTV